MSSSESDEGLKEARRLAKKKKKEKEKKSKKSSKKDKGDISDDFDDSDPEAGKKSSSKKGDKSAPPPPPSSSSTTGGSPPPPPPPPPGGESGKKKEEEDQSEEWKPEKEFKGYVEKTAKYSKRWIKRYITIQDLEFSWANDDNAPAKQKMTLQKVCRGGETKGGDPLSLVLDLEDAKSTKVPFTIRALNKDDFYLWFERFQQALHHNDIVRHPEDGVPKEHPRTKLPFIGIPLEQLAAFGPLDKLCLHFFTIADQKFDQDSKSYSKQAVFLGDRLLYCSRLDANITRCVNMKDINKLLTTKPEEGATGADAEKMHIGVECSSPEHDILFRCSVEEGEKFVACIKAIHAEEAPKGGNNRELEIEPFDRLDVMASQLGLESNEFWKLAISLPMSKNFLKKAVAMWTKEAEAASKKPAPKKKRVIKNAGASNKDEEEGKKENPMGKASPLAGLGQRGKSGGETGGSNSIKPPEIKKGSGPLRIAGSPQSKADQTGVIAIPPGTDKMHRVLLFTGLPQYFPILQEKGLDWEVFLCMTAPDLKGKGVMDDKHCQILEACLNDTKFMDALKADESGEAPAQPTPSQNGPPPGTKKKKESSDTSSSKKKKEAPSIPKSAAPTGDESTTGLVEMKVIPKAEPATIINGPAGANSAAAAADDEEIEDEDL